MTQEYGPSIEICMCGECEAKGHSKEVFRELTTEEIANLQALGKARAAELEAQEAEATRIANLKASAKTKLIAGTPLTEEEAATIVL